MSTKQRIPSDDLSFEPDELAEVGAVLAPASQVVEREDAASGQTPPQAMASFDDQVDAAFSEEETAEKQPAISDDVDLHADMAGFDESAGDLVGGAPAVSVQSSSRSGSGQAKSSAGEIDDLTPPAIHAESSNLPSVIFDDSPFGEDAKASGDDGHPITPHVAAVAAAMDGQAPAVADAVLSSSPPPSANALLVSVQTESGGSLSKTVTHGRSSAAASDAHDEHEDLFSEPVSPSGATPVVHLDDAEFHLVEDHDEAHALASERTPVAEEDSVAPVGEPITSAPPVETGATGWLATSAATPPAVEQATAADSTWNSADSGPITTVSVDEIDAVAGDTTESAPLSTEAAGDWAAQTAPIAEPAVASQVSPSRDSAPRRPSTSAVQAAPPPPPVTARPAPPPPPPAATRPAAPPPPPAIPAKPVAIAQPAKSAPAPAPAALPNFGEDTKLKKKKRGKQWFEEIFDEDYLHTLPFLTPQQTEREVEYLLGALEMPTGSRLLDIGCGYGRHAMELAARGYRTVGLDLSLPLLIRATDAARRVGVNVDFVHGDMRDMTFENEFDGAYCYFTTFGYFDDETNRRVAAGICRSLKPGGRLVLDLINRDCLIGDLPTRVWWQGHGCVVLEEVDFNYFTSRLEVQRQIILEDGRQLVQDISIRAYSLHEIGKILHHAGFRVLEVSGSFELRNRFYGTESRQLLIVAEKRPPDASA
ncbi:MAG: methyltransferase domain-containing protein [Myxococcales bacterium]|nr:methyltransferase domain-containing protein [Myxococcales bacterium]